MRKLYRQLLFCLFVCCCCCCYTAFFFNDPQYIDGELSVRLMCSVAVWLLFSCLVCFCFVMSALTLIDLHRSLLNKCQSMSGSVLGPSACGKTCMDIGVHQVAVQTKGLHHCYMMVAFDEHCWFIPDYITIACFKVLTILEKNK